MTKTTLIAVISNHLNTPKNMTKQLVDSFLDTISPSLSKGKEVRIQGFGTFKVSKWATRQAVNPRTDKKIQIKAMNVASFKAGKELKSQVNK